MVGHGTEGKPIYEPTPIHVLAVVLGLAFGIAVYSVVSYFVLRSIDSRR